MKWGGTAVAVLLLVAWGVSEVWWLHYETRLGYVHLYRGEAGLVRHGPGTFPGVPGWSVGPQVQTPRRWWPAFRGPGAPWFQVSVPLWLPLSAATLVAAFGWRRARRAGLDDGEPRCGNCRYNRTGLAPGANCPECNAPPK